MRIRVIRAPTEASIDGIQLDHFLLGCQYEVGHHIGELMLAEGWAEPVSSDEPAVLIPFSEFAPGLKPRPPQNLIREIFPPSYESPLATDRPRKPRPRRR
jgi:hypothetical protein